MCGTIHARHRGRGDPSPTELYDARHIVGAGFPHPFYWCTGQNAVRHRGRGDPSPTRLYDARHIVGAGFPRPFSVHRTKCGAAPREGGPLPYDKRNRDNKCFRVSAYRLHTTSIRLRPPQEREGEYPCGRWAQRPLLRSQTKQRQHPFLDVGTAFYRMLMSHNIKTVIHKQKQHRCHFQAPTLFTA